MVPVAGTHAHASLMHAILSSFVASLYFASASPVLAAAVIGYRDTAVSASEWDPVLQETEGAQCADLAVIFARGTFDKG